MSSTYSKSFDNVISELGSSRHGLSATEASSRLEKYGRNALPRAKPPGVMRVFLRQFASPLIYVLGVAAMVSMIIEEWSDAGFIGGVLLVNAIIGTIQEFSAQRAAEALHKMVETNSRVLRDGDTYELSAEELVPGDIVLLESGDKVPADLRLFTSQDLEVDESLLTGESMAVSKAADRILEDECALGDRINMAFAGTLVNRGRGRGIVVGTGLNTELGLIASAVLGKKSAKAPLLVRMESFTHRVAILVAVAALIMAGVALARGMPLNEIFFLAVALAVSAIPEGLPVALTVALAIGMRRMAKRNVIVRQLVAVEALGSCTYIATDKTGTLTVNRLTARRLILPDGENWEVTGESQKPEGEILPLNQQDKVIDKAGIQHLCLAAVLANEAFLDHRDQGWSFHGDAVDIALLIMAHKAGINRAEATNKYLEIATIPFESEHLFSASLNKIGDSRQVFVKGAVEKILPMCTSMAGKNHGSELDASLVDSQALVLAKQGYRVIAIAAGEINLGPQEVFSEEHLNGLELLGLVGMIDPLRSEAANAVAECFHAGVEVAMVTGDHPATALAIGNELGLVDSTEQVVTGPELSRAANEAEFDKLALSASIFARVEPHQKLDIVNSLQRSGHFVAVSGDGANDAPALRASQVGVAMGESGTDVARETAELIITDDNFSSIVAGIEEGRVAYANVRKVIFLLISTGVAELVLFTLALLTGLPLPLLAVQLLWLNLVTNGIQDVALAFEPGEGDELKQPPRSPKEPIFNRLMIERVVISSVVMGCMAFLVFQWSMNAGFSVEESRNITLLLMVLFENIHVFNSRSEKRSVLRHNPLRNPVLLIGTILAQLVHIGAMYTPWLNDVLGVQPVSLGQWLELLWLALSILLVMEIHKAVRAKFFSGKGE